MIVFLAEMAEPNMAKCRSGIIGECLSTGIVAQVTGRTKDAVLQVLRIIALLKHLHTVIISQALHHLRIRDATLTDSADILGKLLCQSETVLYIRDEGSEVAIVDAIHVWLQFGVLKVPVVVHLQENLQPQLMSHF